MPSLLTPRWAADWSDDDDLSDSPRARNFAGGVDRLPWLSEEAIDAARQRRAAATASEDHQRDLRCHAAIAATQLRSAYEGVRGQAARALAGYGPLVQAHLTALRRVAEDDPASWPAREAVGALVAGDDQEGLRCALLRARDPGARALAARRIRKSAPGALGALRLAKEHDGDQATRAEAEARLGSEA